MRLFKYWWCHRNRLTILWDICTISPAILWLFYCYKIYMSLLLAWFLWSVSSLINWNNNISRGSGRQAEPHNHIGKKKPMNWFSHGYHGQRYCSWARTHDGGVAQHGGHTPNNRLTETCSLGLPCTSLILDIHVMITLTPVKTRYLLTSITWPYRRLKSTTRRGYVFFEVDRWPGVGFRLDRGLMSG